MGFSVLLLVLALILTQSGLASTVECYNIEEYPDIHLISGQVNLNKGRSTTDIGNMQAPKVVSLDKIYSGL